MHNWDRTQLPLLPGEHTDLMFSSFVDGLGVSSGNLGRNGRGTEAVAPGGFMYCDGHSSMLVKGSKFLGMRSNKC